MLGVLTSHDEGDIPCRLESSSRLSLFLVVGPGDVFVVGGAGREAAVQDADQAIAELAQGRAVADPASAELVVVAAGAGRAAQRGEGLQAEGVDEPGVVHIAGHDEGLLAGLAGGWGWG